MKFNPYLNRNFVQEQISQLNQNQGTTYTSPLMEKLSQVINGVTDMARNSVNVESLAMQLAQQNPNMAEAIKYVKQNGGNPKTACMNMLRQNGINPVDIEKLVPKR